MVFESFVANILNGVLGDFVDNLDPSQLNIGIWGGDVKLHKLEIKESAFDSWGFPIKVKFGYLNALIMKIPWNKLFTRPVIVDIEGLHIIVVPNRGVVYDEEKARKSERETKQKELNALEENRNAKRKDKEDINDTFVEKLLAQVIKNLQINIKSIHVRYEDKYSNRHRPFAAGITLENLEFQTTEANFQAKIHKEETKIFYKLVSLNNLAIYWNSDSKLISDMESKKNILSALNAKIATKRSQPRDYKYAFGPITMTTKLSLNQKPEVDKFKVPKIDLSVETDELSLCIRQPQYQDLLHFLEAQKRFNLAQRYLKYRPYLTEYRGHYKEWYQFAYNCIVSDIRRRRTNWSWAEMKKHRQMVRAYREAWLHFRTEKHPSAVHKRTIEEAEEKLDTFNLNIARQQADMDIDRLGFVRTEDQAVQTWSSWVKSWFGRTAPVTPAHMPKGQAFVAQLQESITPEEKAKLFAAIDYQGNILPTKYPKEFVENKVSVKVLSVTIAVDSAIQLSFSELTMDLAQRSSARAIHLKCSVKTISITGLGHSILTMLIPEEYWLNAEFITNPLDGSFDQFVGLTTAPLLLKYHARAANAFLDVFRTPRSVRPNQLATAAFARYEAAKFYSLETMASTSSMANGTGKKRVSTSSFSVSSTPLGAGLKSSRLSLNGRTGLDTEDIVAVMGNANVDTSDVTFSAHEIKGRYNVFTVNDLGSADVKYVGTAQSFVEGMEYYLAFVNKSTGEAEDFRPVSMVQFQAKYKPAELRNNSVEREAEEMKAAELEDVASRRRNLTAEFGSIKKNKYLDNTFRRSLNDTTLETITSGVFNVSSTSSPDAKGDTTLDGVGGSPSSAAAASSDTSWLENEKKRFAVPDVSLLKKATSQVLPTPNFAALKSSDVYSFDQFLPTSADDNAAGVMESEAIDFFKKYSTTEKLVEIGIPRLLATRIENALTYSNPGKRACVACKAVIMGRILMEISATSKLTEYAKIVRSELPPSIVSFVCNEFLTQTTRCGKEKFQLTDRYRLQAHFLCILLLLDGSGYSMPLSLAAQFNINEITALRLLKGLGCEVNTSTQEEHALHGSLRVARLVGPPRDKNEKRNRKK